jgi:hypothetical protein
MANFEVLPQLKKIRVQGINYYEFKLGIPTVTMFVDRKEPGSPVGAIDTAGNGVDFIPMGTPTRIHGADLSPGRGTPNGSLPSTPRSDSIEYRYESLLCRLTRDFIPICANGSKCTEKYRDANRQDGRQSCRRWHDEKDCASGNRCTRADCNLAHPRNFVGSAICKHGKACPRRLACTFNHSEEDIKTWIIEFRISQQSRAIPIKTK